MNAGVHRAFSIVAACVIAIAIAWGISLVGSPKTARLLRFDEQRLRDLRTIHREVQSLCRDPDLKEQLKRALPETLEELARLAEAEKINLNDPETGQPYEYRVRDETNYELCAGFSMARDSDVDVFWNHRGGRHCFTVNALDPPRAVGRGREP